MALMDSNLLNTILLITWLTVFMHHANLGTKLGQQPGKTHKLNKNTLPSVYQLFNKRIKDRSIGRVIMQWTNVVLSVDISPFIMRT